MSAMRGSSCVVVLSLAAVVTSAAPISWSTSGNSLLRDGSPVVLHGLGTTCTEYLLRGIGMDCNTAYNWANPSTVLQVNSSAVGKIIDVLTQAANTATPQDETKRREWIHGAPLDQVENVAADSRASPSVLPVVRIPMTASYWLGVETQASKGNMAKYPKLSQQYQDFIGELVRLYTNAGVVVLLDLHWSDDDVMQAPMASKGASNCITFWDSVASTFANNSFVFYELYNEPYIGTVDVWMNGDSKTAGMLEMLAAVRKHTQNPAVIAGAAAYAYDSASLVQLDAHLKAQGEANVMYNFHPYMGAPQAGDLTKCPDGFEHHVKNIMDSTDKPVIVTEFGQACCPTHGACERCSAQWNGTTMGYDEAILSIATANGVSWLPWAWRPGATGPNSQSCMDLNGGGTPPGTGLAHPTDGNGADFLTLWKTFASRTGGGPVPPPPPPPSPSGCPGGSLDACMALCPANPPAAFKACVDNCAAKCPHQRK